MGPNTARKFARGSLALKSLRSIKYSLSMLVAARGVFVWSIVSPRSFVVRERPFLRVITKVCFHFTFCKSISSSLIDLAVHLSRPQYFESMWHAERSSDRMALVVILELYVHRRCGCSHQHNCKLCANCASCATCLRRRSR